MNSHFTLFVALLLLVAGMPAGALGATPELTADSSFDPQASDSLLAATPDTLETSVTVERSGDDVVVSISYDVPSDVTRIELTSRAFDRSDVEVVEQANLDRTSATSFEWSGGAAPQLTYRIAVRDPPFGPDSAAVGTDAWVLVDPFVPSLRLWYRGSDPPERTTTVSVSGEGYASQSLAYLGPHERFSRETPHGTATLVAPAGAEVDGELDSAFALYASSVQEFPVGIQYDETVAFVLPSSMVSNAYPGGFTIRSTVVMQDRALGTSSPGNVLAHEYVHTRMGVFYGSSAWLREASAQYIGALLSLNEGIGTFAAFRSYVRAPAYAGGETVLTDEDSWSTPYADYEKGAHVLAALDAEIRTRTDGEHRLEDVLARRLAAEYGSFHEYEGFRQAVIDVTDDPSMGEWLDRYVTTGAVPTVPDDPYLYVDDFSADVDSDGLTAAEERQHGLAPFSADTDDDGLADGTELSGETDPLNSDTDGDGRADGVDSHPMDASQPTDTPARTATAQSVDDSASATDQSSRSADDDAPQPPASLDQLLMRYPLPSGPTLVVLWAGTLTVFLLVRWGLRR